MTLTCIVVESTGNDRYVMAETLSMQNADSLVLFALNIDILPANVAKPERSNISNLA